MAVISHLGHFPFCVLDKVPIGLSTTEFANVGIATHRIPLTNAIGNSLGSGGVSKAYPFFDGGTFFDQASTFVLSQSPTEFIAGVGAGTLWPVGMTLEECINLYWRIKTFKLSFAPAPSWAIDYASTTWNISSSGSFDSEYEMEKFTNFGTIPQEKDLSCPKSRDLEAAFNEGNSQEIPVQGSDSGEVDFLSAGAFFNIYYEALVGPFQVLYYNDLYWPRIYLNGTFWYNLSLPATQYFTTLSFSSLWNGGVSIDPFGRVASTPLGGTAAFNLGGPNRTFSFDMDAFWEGTTVKDFFPDINIEDPPFSRTATFFPEATDLNNPLEFTFKPVWYEYDPNDGGGPIYDSETGAQLRDF